VQERPGPQIAEIMNAVNAYAERSGALILAEGIETEQHLSTARALGARLGQGWLLGRPAAGPAPGHQLGRLVLPAAPPADSEGSPFGCLAPGTPLRRSPKNLLIEVSKQLEREAMRVGQSCVVAATFQEAKHFTLATTRRYRDLVERTGFVCAVGEGLSAEPFRGCAVPTSHRTTRCGASGTSWCSVRTSPRRCWPATSATPGRTCSGPSSTP
jgi:hypothetical protein